MNMIVATQYRKLHWLTFLLSAALAVLGVRLVDLQVVRHDELRALAQTNTVRTFARQPMRGQILDIRGNPLATSLPAKTVCANPSLLGNRREAVARALAPLLQTDESSLAARLAPRLTEVKGRTTLSRYVVLKNKVPMETWEKIKQTMARLSFGLDETKLNAGERATNRNVRGKAIFAEDDQIRVYPSQRLAAHVLGFVSSDEEQTGLSGVELAFNADLSGIPGWRKTEMDKHQRELVAYRDQDVEPRDGLNVVLDPGCRLAEHCRKRTGRRHGKAFPDQRFVHHGAPAHRRNSGHGDPAQFRSEPARPFPDGGAAQPRDFGHR